MTRTANRLSQFLGGKHLYAKSFLDEPLTEDNEPPSASEQSFSESQKYTSWTTTGTSNPAPACHHSEEQGNSLRPSGLSSPIPFAQGDEREQGRQDFLRERSLLDDERRELSTKHETLNASEILPGEGFHWNLACTLVENPSAANWERAIRILRDLLKTPLSSSLDLSDRIGIETCNELSSTNTNMYLRPDTLVPLP